MNSEFSELLSALSSAEVRFLVVGGYAVLAYSEPRYTKDLDLFVATDPGNASKVYSVLKEFGAPLVGLTEKDFREPGVYQMGRPPLRVDVLMDMPGADFEDCWERRVALPLFGVVVPHISAEDLVLAKRACGRPSDLADAKAIERAMARRRL